MGMSGLPVPSGFGCTLVMGDISIVNRYLKILFSIKNISFVNFDISKRCSHVIIFIVSYAAILRLNNIIFVLLIKNFFDVKYGNLTGFSSCSMTGPVANMSRY